MTTAASLVQALPSLLHLAESSIHVRCLVGIQLCRMLLLMIETQSELYFTLYPADHDYCRFESALLVNQITILKMKCVSKLQDL